MTAVLLSSLMLHLKFSLTVELNLETHTVHHIVTQEVFFRGLITICNYFPLLLTL